MNYTFDGSISREVLNNYLSRAVTHCGIGQDCTSISQTFEDDLRMLRHEGAKFIGRAAFIWSTGDDAVHFDISQKKSLAGPRSRS